MTIVGGYCVHERNARQLPTKVGGVALAVLGVVQDGVDVVEDVPLADGGIVVAAELFKGSVGSGKFRTTRSLTTYLFPLAQGGDCTRR